MEATHFEGLVVFEAAFAVFVSELLTAADFGSAQTLEFAAADNVVFVSVRLQNQADFGEVFLGDAHVYLAVASWVNHGCFRAVNEQVAVVG